MNKAPDLNIIDLHPALRQLGHQPAQREVGGGSFQQPVAIGPGQNIGLVTAHLTRRRAARLPDTPHPFYRRTRRYAKARRRGMARQAIL